VAAGFVRLTRDGKMNMGRLIKYAGGKWHRNRRVWELADKDVLKLGLSKMIVPKGE